MAQHHRAWAGETRITSDTQTVFETLTKESIPAIIRRVDFRSGDEAACEITIEVSGEHYQQIVHNEWFHLFHTMSADAPAMDADQPVEIRAALRSNLTDLIAQQGGDAEEVFRCLLQETPDKRIALNRTECWLAMEVKQRSDLPESLEGSGTLKTGYQTGWSRQTLQAEHTTLRERIEGFLQLKGLKYEWADEQIIRLRFMSRNGNWIGLIHLAEDEGYCVIYSVLPDAVPENRRPLVAEALMSANYDLSGGSYEMDEEDGELRYRTTVFLGSTQDPDELGTILARHLQQVEADLPAIRQLIEEG